VQLATKGEMRPTPDVEITLDPVLLHVTAGRVVWPKTRDLEVTRDGARVRIALEKPDRYTALFLKIG
jgi:hypothetical protein